MGLQILFAAWALIVSVVLICVTLRLMFINDYLESRHQDIEQIPDIAQSLEPVK